MARYQLVSFKACPWVQRVAIVLREKDIEFEFRHIVSDKRPDWFRTVSPHNKVPVLRVNDQVSLFESCAIAEYLDEMHSPQLHPEDPIERAINRAWIEYVPTFADLASGHAYAKNEVDYNEAAVRVAEPLEKLEKALQRHDDGPYFNGPGYSLVDAAYAPFLQRHFFLERIKTIGQIDKFPRVKIWAEAVVGRPSTHSFPPAEYEAMYRDMVKRRNSWMSQFLDGSNVAAE